MATSSIIHNFVLTDAESAASFAEALDEAERERTEHRPSAGKLLTESKEILNLMENWKKHHAGKLLGR